MKKHYDHKMPGIYSIQKENKFLPDFLCYLIYIIVQQELIQFCGYSLSGE